jgi:hypothetical protein
MADRSFDEMFPDTSKQASFDEMFPESGTQAASADVSKSSPFDLQSKPKLQQETRQLDRHKGNVKWFEDLKQQPVIGPVVAGAQNIANNAALMGREVKRNPMNAIPAAAASFGTGALGAVEAPVALVTNALGGVERMMNPEAQPPSYNQLVGGQSLQDRGNQFINQEFPGTQGTQATMGMAGGMAVPVKGIGPAEQLASRAMQEAARNPVVNRAIGYIIKAAVNHPRIANLARGATEGAGINAVYEAGGHAARGEAPTVSASGTLGGALAGGSLRAIGALRGKPKEVAPTETETKAPETTVQKQPAQIIKPQPKPQFANLEEAFAARESKNTSQVEAANKYIQENWGKNLQSEQATAEPENPIKGGFEENVQPEEEKINPSLQAIYEKTGKAPVKSEPEPTEENEYVGRQRITLDQLDEGGRKTAADKGKAFDVANAEVRPAWVTRNGVRRKHIVEPKFDENGNFTHAIAHRVIGGKSQAEIADAIRAVKEGTAIGARLAAKEAFTPEQQHANERALEEQAAPEPQAEAARIAAQRQAQIQKTIDVIQNDDMEGADKSLQQQPEKVTDVKKPTTLYADPLLIGPIMDTAKAIGTAPSKVAEAIYGADWKDALKEIAKANDTLDTIKEFADTTGDDIHNKLWHNIAGEALDTRGVKFEGETAKEARDALRNFTPDEILDPENTPGWTEEQRQAVATKKVYRMDTKDQIKKVLQNYDEISPKYRQALQEYSKQQYGYSSGNSGYDPFQRVMDGIGHGVYTGLFRWNPAFHALVATHPLQVGSSVVGIRNIGHAYQLRLFDPQIKEFMSGLSGATEDIRTQLSDERLQGQGSLTAKINKPFAKPLIKDIPTGQFNNEIIALGGMLKRGQALGGNGEQAVRDLIEGKLSREDQLDMMNAGMQAMREGTGSGTFGMNRTMLQKSPLLRTFAQLSGYRQTVYRLYSRYARDMMKGGEAGREAGKALGTLMGMTVLLGGHAVIPKEIEKTLFRLNPKGMLAVEYALDQMNLPAKAGINLTDHMQSAFINWGINVGLENLGSAWDKINKISPSDIGGTLTGDQEARVKLEKTLGNLLMIMPIAPGGVGASTYTKGISGAETAAKGSKNITAYPNSLFKSDIPIGKATMKYNFWDALHDEFFPGSETRVYNFKQAKRLTDLMKQAGAEDQIPANLEEAIGKKGEPGYKAAMYPHEGIEEGGE